MPQNIYTQFDLTMSNSNTPKNVKHAAGIKDQYYYRMKKMVQIGRLWLWPKLDLNLHPWSFELANKTEFEKKIGQIYIKYIGFKLKNLLCNTENWNTPGPRGFFICKSIIPQISTPDLFTPLWTISRRRSLVAC